MKRALVTGGAGFIGSNLALELERRGTEVVVLDDFSTGSYENLRGFSGDVVAGDLCRPEQWTARIGEIDAIFHQAANTDTTVTDQRKMMESNVEAFRNLLDFAAQPGVRRRVYASSAGVYGAGPVPMRETGAQEPMNVYGFSKKVMESVARSWSRSEPALGLIGLRYFNVYGPREQSKAKAASMIWQLHLQMRGGRRPRVFKFGEQYRDFIYVKDVVAANLAAAQKKVSGVFNVCTGKKTTFNEVIDALNATLGARHKPDYFKNPYSFYQNETLGDPGQAARQLKFRARYSVAEGIEDYFKGRKTGAAAGA